VVNTFLIANGAVIFNFPNGISVHIRQGENNQSSVVAYTPAGMAYNPSCGNFDLHLGASAGEMTLTGEELAGFLYQMVNTNKDFSRSETRFIRNSRCTE
jgi:hypothetical protein